LENRFGDEIRNLGIEPAALTRSEATYLAGFRDVDQLRNRVSKAKGERERRLRAKGIRPQEGDRLSLSATVNPRFADDLKRITANLAGSRLPDSILVVFEREAAHRFPPACHFLICF